MSTPPHGLKEIKALYGDPFDLIREDGSVSKLWEARMVKVPFPTPIALGWIASYATSARVNTAISEEVVRLFRAWHNADLWQHISTFDGGYCWRPKAGNRKLSMHGYGGALDFNARTNQRGTLGDMHHDLIGVAESLGWTWGGRWTNPLLPDPMHFQWGAGY